MTAYAHLIGGQADGAVRTIPEPVESFFVPALRPSPVNGSEWWPPAEIISLRYVRRSLHLTPASFRRRHGPDHLIYDWAGNPWRAERARAQALIPLDFPDAETFWQYVAGVSGQMLYKLNEMGSFAIADLEWRMVQPEELEVTGWPQLGIMRCDVVMEVPR